MPHRVAAIRACALACRFAFAVLLLVATGLHALNIGERYDFLCSDGQDVYNAELTAEDEKNYYVRLSPVMAQVPIEKQFVVSTASKSQAKAVKPQPAGPRFELALGAGADFSLGRLTVLARVAPAAAVPGLFGGGQTGVFLAVLLRMNFVPRLHTCVPYRQIQARGINCPGPSPGSQRSSGLAVASLIFRRRRLPSLRPQ